MQFFDDSLDKPDGRFTPRERMQEADRLLREASGAEPAEAANLIAAAQVHALQAQTEAMLLRR